MDGTNLGSLHACDSGIAWCVCKAPSSEIWTYLCQFLNGDGRRVDGKGLDGSQWGRGKMGGEKRGGTGVSI